MVQQSHEVARTSVGDINYRLTAPPPPPGTFPPPPGAPPPPVLTPTLVTMLEMVKLAYLVPGV